MKVKVNELSALELKELDSNVFIESVMELIYWTYHRFVSSFAEKYNISEEDLFQEAAIEALNSVKKFKDTDVLFSTYLVKNIRFVMFNYINKHKNMVHHTNKAKRLAPHLINADLLEMENSKIVEQEGFEQYSVNDIQESKSYLLNYRMVSLELTQKYQGITDKKRQPYIEVPYVQDFSCIFESDYMSVLNEKEQEYLELVYYGYTQNEMAKEMNISQSSIHRIGKSVSKKVKDFLIKNDKGCAKEYGLI